MVRRSNLPAFVASTIALAVLAASCASEGTTSPPTQSPSPGATTSPEPTLDTTFVVGSEMEPPNLDTYGNVRPTMVTAQVQETLYTRNADGSLTPQLAASDAVPVDDVTWDIPLRAGVTYSDGTPFDAETAAAAFNVLVEQPPHTTQRFNIRRLAAASAVDELTLRLTTSEPEPILPALLAQTFVIKADVEDREETLIGTGPYVLEEWDRGQSVTLVRNETYWGDAPYIERVEIRFVPDAGARLAALLAGEVDLIVNVNPEDEDTVPEFLTVPSVHYPMIVLNAQDGPTEDVRVRRALNHAIDRDALLALFRGHGIPDHCQGHGAGVLGFVADLESYSYDPDLARRLLDEAGATNISIGLVAPDGTYLKDRETSEAIAGFWEAVGVSVELELLQFSQWLERIQNLADRPDAYFGVRTLREFDGSGYEAYFGEQSPVLSLSDRALWDIMASAAREFEADARDRAYQEVARYVCDEAYAAFLPRPADMYGSAGGFEIELPPIGHTYLRVSTVRPA